MGTFKAIRIDKAEKGTTVALTQFDEADLMGRRRHGAGRMVDLELQGRPGGHRQGTGGAALSDDRRHRFRRHRRNLVQSGVEGRRQGDRQWLGHGVKPISAPMPKRRGSRATGWVRLPEGMSTRDAMAIGTAGYTAMLSVLALEKYGLTAKSGPVIVTGAAGGVGSVATAVLSKLGYHVIASTGRMAEADYLKGLGASEVIDRNELSGPAKPLAKERWAAGIDSVGSTTLANVLSMTKYGGAVAACGLAAGMDLPTSVGTVYFARRVSSGHRFRELPDRSAESRLEPVGHRFGSGQTH